ncbi:MAG: sulfatase, partial [Burkholderiaceae bacterium]
VDALKANGQLDDTLIIFTSDNGGERFSDNWPLVGGKMDLTEGGIRVPYIAHWPNGIKQPGRVSSQHCLSMDWTATILDIAGVTPPSHHVLDGVSLRVTLDQVGQEFERPMFWRMNHKQQRAYRCGAWKYLKVEAHEYLFNIEQDARERANQAKKSPERLAAMRTAYERWEQGLPPIPDDAGIGLIYTLADMPAR